MSIFRDFFVKEKPVFTGITRGLGGFGFGAAGGGGSGGGPVSFTIKRYNTSNVLQFTAPYSDVTPGTTYSHANAGYYTLEVDSGSGPAQLQMWAWGGGGGTTGGPGPGHGGAGGGVRGTHTINGGDTITFLVGGGGAYTASTNNVSTAFPDGGSSTPSDGYLEGPGGGRSSIYDGLLPYANRDSTSNTFLLIGGAGGGGSSYSTSGTLDARGGYPSGFPGGAYYDSDSSDGFGKGGTQSAGGNGGAAGREPGGANGGKYDGGPGNGGGGGGGYYGGGGGGGYYAMGGGGSGYIHPTLTNTASFTALPGHPDHKVSVDDPANPGIKPTPAAYSGYGGLPNGGQDGVVVFKVL